MPLLELYKYGPCGDAMDVSDGGVRCGFVDVLLWP
jgi:hypothetical protein